MRTPVLSAILLCCLPSAWAQEGPTLRPGDLVPELPTDPFIPGPPPPEGEPLPERDAPDGVPLPDDFPGRPDMGPDISPNPLPGADDPPPAAMPVPKVTLRPSGVPEQTWENGCQFRIWGGTQIERGRLFTAAKILRRNVLDALRLPDDWRYPVVIQLRDPATRSPSGRPVWTSISQLPDGFRLEVNLVPRRGRVSGELLRENLTRAILAEMVLRGHESEDLSAAPMPPPDWILHGTLELLDYRELGRMSESFATVFRLGRVLGVEDIVNADPERMDSVSATLYRVSACGLLITLQGQAGSTRSMQELLSASARPGQDMMVLLQQAYPKLTSSTNSLSKWWSLQLASLAQPGMDELQTPAGTEVELQAALTLRFPAEPAAVEKRGLKKLFSRKEKPAPDEGRKTEEKPEEAPPEVTCDITEYTRVLDRPDREAILNRAQLALTKCLLRAHPLYRSVIHEYQGLLTDLAKNRKRKEAAAELPRLAALRARLREVMQGVEDHMDWYEATQAPDKSGLFRGFLQTAEAMEENQPQRLDPVTRYLDAMEEEFRE